MKKIAIIELSGHLIYLSTVVRAARELNLYPVVFISADYLEDYSNYTNLDDPNVDYVVVDYSNPSQLANLRPMLKQCNTILINTISPWVFRLIDNDDFSRCIVTVHNALYETETTSLLSPCLIVLRFIRFVKQLPERLSAKSNRLCHLAHRDITMQRRLLLSQAQSILIFHQNMIDPIAKRASISAESIKKVPFNLPIYTDNFLPLPASTKEVGYLSLAVIGSISFKRKRYDQIFHLLMEFNKHFPVRLTIIGRFSSKSVESRLAKLLSRTNVNTKIVGGPRRAYPDEIFSALKNTHFLVGLQPQFLRNGCTTDYYGYTKATGAEFDALEYNRLLLRPSHVPATREMEGLSLCYKDNKDFASILGTSLKSDTYQNRYKVFVSARNRAFSCLRGELHSALNSRA